MHVPQFSAGRASRVPEAEVAVRAGPLRVLHVLGSLAVGGVETWIASLVRQIDRRRVAMDFLVHAEVQGGYTEEIRKSGSRILLCPLGRDPVGYAARFLHVLRANGPYQVVHSHVHHFSGYVLWLARLAGVPGRIAHSHSDTRRCDTESGLMRRLYLRTMESAIRTAATAGIGANQVAAEALFGKSWRDNPRNCVIFCGIDTEPFHRKWPKNEVRAEFGIPSSAFVVGHVGRFAEPKNHTFLVQFAGELAKGMPEARFLWVGDGPLRPDIEGRVTAAGLSERVVMPGTRRDVARLLCAMDVFVFPSLWESNPLSLTEAQAAGLPCIVSDAISEEAFSVPSLVTALPLDYGAPKWAAAVAATRGATPAATQREALEVIEQSSFSSSVSARKTEQVYEAYR
jgi:glycosyltransferase involved in cell wall biosynthesis